MSDFLGGLIQPGHGARHAAERELHRRVEAWGNQTQFVYRGPADFILQHGSYCKPRETPPEYVDLRGPLTYCFGNAMRVALEHPELIYTEGVYVVMGRISEHAWVTAPDGHPVELTFPTDPTELKNSVIPLEQYDAGGVVRGDPRGGYATPLTSERWAYYGVQFPHVSLVEEIVKLTDTTAIIDKPEAGYPLLRQPWTPLMKRLP